MDSPDIPATALPQPEPASRTTALIILVRPPVLGQVKTRLARTLGDRFALEFYSLCTRHVTGELQRLAAPRYDTTPFLFVADAADPEPVRRLCGAAFAYRAQQGESFGERMYNAFREVFASGARQAMIVPSDAPDLSADLILRAQAALRDHDAVFGPASDGGYYLLGLKAAYRPLFFDIPWSTEVVGAITRARLAELKLRVAELDCLADIDEAGDLYTWLRAAGKHPLKHRLEMMLQERLA